MDKENATNYAVSKNTILSIDMESNVVHSKIAIIADLDIRNEIFYQVSLNNCYTNSYCRMLEKQSEVKNIFTLTDNCGTDNDITDQAGMPEYKYIPSIELSHPEQLQFILYIMITEWNNLCGPKIWKVLHNPQFDKTMLSRAHSAILSFTSNHNLSGEIWRLVDSSILEFKIYFFIDSDMISLSFALNVNENVISASYFFPYSQISFFIPIYSQVKILIEKEMSKFRNNINTIQKKTSALEIFEKSLLKIVTTIKELRYFTIDVSYNNPLLQKKNFNSFYQTCITSHLQAGSYSVIIGKNETNVNNLMSVLSLFTIYDDHILSRSFSDSYNSYRSYLHIQALNSETVKDNIAKYSNHQVAVIELDKNIVSIFVPPHFLFVNSKSIDNFKRVRNRSRLLKDFFADYFLLPNDHAIRNLFIKDFLRLILRMSYSVLQFKDWKNEKPELYSQQNATLLFTQLKQELLIEKDEDFHIILAFAENLKPMVITSLFKEFISRNISQSEITSIL